MNLKGKGGDKLKQTSLDKLVLKPKAKQQSSVLKESSKLRKWFGKYLNSHSKHINKRVHTHHKEAATACHDTKKSFENAKGLVALQSGKKMTKAAQK